MPCGKPEHSLGKEPGRHVRLTPAGLRNQHLLALALFLAASLVLFGPPLFPHFSSVYLGNTSDDPKIFMWALTWWPHAIAHGLNPFYPHVVWHPVGYNLAWGTGIPGPSLLLAPLTLTGGVIATFNVLALAGPALSGFTCYLLCRYLTGAFWPSVAGGYLFGFSTYEMIELQSHLNLYFVCFVPLCALLALKHHRREIRTRTFVILLTLCLVAEFSISVEVFASLVLFGGVALLVGLLALRGESRSRLLRTTGAVVLAGAITGAVASPYLYAAVAYPQPTKVYHPGQTSSDLMGFIVPSGTTLVGNGQFRSYAANFGAPGENGAYFGIPLLVGMALFVVTGWRNRVTRWLALAFLAFVVLSLGPKLKIDGRRTVFMPWRPFVHLPLVARALPARFTMYAWLVAAVAMAMWLARPGRWAPARWVPVLLTVVLIFPNLPSGLYHTEPVVPKFFTEGISARVFKPGEVVMVSGNARSDGVLWQATSWMGFTMPFAWLGLNPPRYEERPLAKALAFDSPPSVEPAHLKKFLQDHGVQAIVLRNQHELLWEELYRPLGVKPVKIGGVLLYRLPTGKRT